MLKTKKKNLNIIKNNNNNKKKKLTLAKWFNNNCEVFQSQVGSFYCFLILNGRWESK